MFGYDRDRGLIRLFIPFSVFKRFQELNESQKVIVKQITQKGLDTIHLLYAHDIRPSRGTVIDSRQSTFITGGVNYFAAYPVNDTLDKLDALLTPYADKGVQEVSVSLILDILSHIGTEDATDWNPTGYSEAVRMIADKNNLSAAKLLVSTDHRIGKHTGTMLTPTDRIESDRYPDKITLIMYRLTGETEKGWNGQPFWMPNIKLPEGFVFYNVEG